MKKFLGVLLAVVMVVSLCASGLTAAAEEPEYVPHKLGVIIYGVDDPFAAQMYRDINRAAELLNIEVIWTIGTLDPIGQITDAENLIAAGVEGIMCLTNSETSTQKIMQVCEKAGVFFTITLRSISDPDIYEEVTNSKYWAGNVTEDQYVMGQTVVEHLYELGCRKIGLLFGLGDQSYEIERNRAFVDTAERLGMEVLATYSPINGTNDAEVASENFIVSYPEMDGIAMCTGAVGNAEMLISTVNRLGVADKVKIGICDTFTGEYDAFVDKSVHITSGGFSPDGLFSFMMLYNAVDGHPWTTEKGPELIQNCVYITNAEECAAYDKYVDTPEYNIYSDDVIRSLVTRHNPEVDLEYVQNLMSQYNIEYIIANAVPAK